MKKDRLRVFALISKFVWVASIAFVAYFSLVPDLDLHIKIRNVDKVYHSLAYLWLATVPFIGFQQMKAALAGALMMIPFGIAMEFAQRSFTQERAFSFGDIIANSFGVILGVGLGLFLRSRFFADLEYRLKKH